jgi:glycosyltransferase involved in cell wall biosynthesis
MTQGLFVTHTDVSARPISRPVARRNAKDSTRIRIAILHPSDLLGNSDGGIDSFIRGVLAFAPNDLEFTLIGATTNIVARPVGTETTIKVGSQIARFLPIVRKDPSGIWSREPLIVRYTRALVHALRDGILIPFDILDFHRIEPSILFRRDPRPKNLYMHQDLSGVTAERSEILWRHLPRIYATMEHWLMPAFHRLFSVRHTSVVAYAKRFPKLATRIEFMPTFIDTKFWCPLANKSERQALRNQIAAETGANANGNWLIAVGRLALAKDPLLLLAAFSTLLKRRPTSHLFIIGDGPLKPEINDACASLTLAKSVSLLGSRPAVYIRRFLQAADAFVLSSSYEGMPIALLEALASGTPVVSTDVGEVRFMVTNGCNGRISTDRSPSGLAVAIEDVLSNAEALRDNCVQSVEAFVPQNVLGRLHSNYCEQV